MDLNKTKNNNPNLKLEINKIDAGGLLPVWQMRIGQWWGGPGPVAPPRPICSLHANTKKIAVGLLLIVQTTRA
jgi:hypothetical protein